MPKLMNIRIVSDGTETGTYVETLDGVRLQATRITWSAGVGEFVKATVEFIDVEANVLSTVATPARHKILLNKCSKCGTEHKGFMCPKCDFKGNFRSKL
jgi:hypothetical protein